MDFLIPLFTEQSVAHAVLILGLVAAIGLALGSIRIYGVNLGIAMVLFVGLAFGHFGMGIDHEVLDFIKEFGLILFVYTIGIQVGPGFFASLKRQGLPLNLMAAGIVTMGAVLTLLIANIAQIDILAAVGMFSGATTNTPSLGAAQQAIASLPGVTPQELESMKQLPGLGYAVAYPFGVFGIILTLILTRFLFRVDVERETRLLLYQQKKTAGRVSTMNILVTNPNMDGLTCRGIPGLADSGVIISRILHDDELSIVQPDTEIHTGDILLLVGPPEKLRSLQLILGTETDVNLKELPSNLITRRIIVTRQKALGKSLEELDLYSRFGVTVTRVSRAEIEFTATWDFKLQFADTLLVVGTEEGIRMAADELGNSAKQLNHPQVIPLFLGIALGVLLGSFPIEIAGMPAPVKLGLAGGPLVMAIILSRIGRIGPLIWYMPISANFILREVGIVMFLACVGLNAGNTFVDTLVSGDGLKWMAWATLITFLPIFTMAVFARVFMRTNYVTLCGLLSGSMTDPPALAFATTATNSDAPSISYATVYPLTMLLRVMYAQLIVLLFASRAAG